MNHEDQKHVWNKIAPGWTHYRNKPVKEVEEFADTIKKVEKKKIKLLDIGCGNCRNLLPFSHKCFDLHGIDFSDKMLKEARKFCKGHDMCVQLKKADMTQLPYPNNHFDIVLCISSLHHLESEDKRIKALKEMERVLKKHGLAMISVWSKDGRGDRYVPWKTKEEDLMRFYHFFSKNELERLIKISGFYIEKQFVSGDEEKNMFFIIKKVR